jgi:hypothetical protein
MEPELRPLNKIPVFVEEDHHQVLPHIFRSVGAKHLPANGNAMVHFDSHPDLLLPANLQASDASNVYVLYEKLSIENWILPACFLGVIDTVIWVAPPWSNQIPQGKHEFLIGRHKQTNQVLVTCLQNYFIAEGLICDPAELVDTKSISLYVVQLTAENPPAKMNDLNLLREVLANKTATILDIDLDFYSTRNPFLGLYSEINLYQTLKQIYTFEALPNSDTGSSLLVSGGQADRLKHALVSCGKRKALLESLDDLTSHLAQGSPLQFYEGPASSDHVGQFGLIQRSIQSNCGKSEHIDWKMIHDAGCTCDDTDLPHHISSNEEISILLRQTRMFVQHLQITPAIVTVSRSSLDEFCPENQVEMIQSQVVELLQNLVGGSDKLDIRLGYQNME